MIRDLRGVLGGACLLVPVLIRLTWPAGRASIGPAQVPSWPAVAGAPHAEREPTDRGAVL